MALTKRNQVKCFTPSMPLIEGVTCLSTLRTGGISASPYDSFNLGLHVGDIESDVLQNRSSLPCPPSIAWLNQIHSDQVVEASTVIQQSQPIDADASWTANNNVVCCVMTADCLPVLLIDKKQKKVAAVHCGWRGLLQKLITKTLVSMNSRPEDMQVWLGPAIGPKVFEVGLEVKNAFAGQYQSAFLHHASLDSDKFFADVYKLATIELNAFGIHHAIYQDDHCTYSHDELFFSYRRDGVTGRMASLIWLHDS